MKILIINAGSSSLKYQFMESEGGRSSPRVCASVSASTAV